MHFVLEVAAFLHSLIIFSWDFQNMQNIAHLEAQIEKELAELSKIQGVLADMKKPKTGGLADKENRTPQKRLERHTKVENSEKKKSALKPIESTRKYKRPPDPGALNMSNSKQTKKVVLMPETVHKPAGLTVKPEKSMPHVDQNEENVQEHAGPGLKLQALPIKKKARHPEERLSSQANKQIPGNVKETSDDDIIRTSELLRAFKNEDDDLRSSQIKPTETLKDKSTDIASDEKITKTQLPVPKSSKKVGRINSSRKRMSKERQSQGPLLDIKEKSVDELAHEQLERINREFRDARIKTKNFDDRVKLMVLEVTSTDVERNPGDDAEADQKGQGYRDPGEGAQGMHFLTEP